MITVDVNNENLYMAPYDGPTTIELGIMEYNLLLGVLNSLSFTVKGELRIVVKEQWYD